MKVTRTQIGRTSRVSNGFGKREREWVVAIASAARTCSPTEARSH
jgi:hypothetical protein